MYDGNVCVYNLQVGTKDPIYMSHGVNGKHSECVWEVSDPKLLRNFVFIKFKPVVDQMGSRYARRRDKFLFGLR